LIKEESTSGLLRFTIRHILEQVHNQPKYLVLVQEQQEKAQNNQLQIHNQYGLHPTTITDSHQHQVPNISCTNNLVGQKMTLWKLSSLLSSHTNQPYVSGNGM
jgi:hypothetical protein